MRLAHDNFFLPLVPLLLHTLLLPLLLLLLLPLLAVGWLFSVAWSREFSAEENILRRRIKKSKIPFHSGGITFSAVGLKINRGSCRILLSLANPECSTQYPSTIQSATSSSISTLNFPLDWIFRLKLFRHLVVPFSCCSFFSFLSVSQE